MTESSFTGRNALPAGTVLTPKQQRSRDWHSKNPTYGRDWYRAKRKEDPTYGPARHKRKHGISQEEYDILLERQGGVCAICGQTETHKRGDQVWSLSIDHDHGHCPGKYSCGKCIRGLICGSCNHGLGAFKDNIDVIQSALSYLARRPEDEGVKSAGHPPSASKRICVDFDQTLYPFGDLFGGHPPLAGAVDAMRKINNAGFTIYIFTSRLSPAWWTAEGWDHGVAENQQRTYIDYVLTRDGIPYHHLTGEKVPSLAYIDDKAIEFTGANWGEIAERVLTTL